MKTPKKTPVDLTWLGALIDHLLEQGMPKGFVMALCNAIEHETPWQEKLQHLSTENEKWFGPPMIEFVRSVIAVCGPKKRKAGSWRIERQKAAHILSHALCVYFGGPPESEEHDASDGDTGPGKDDDAELRRWRQWAAKSSRN